MTTLEAQPDPIASLYSARRRARRRLLGHLVMARDHERRRMASAIHDEPLQELTAATARLSRARGMVEDPQVRYELGQAEEELRDAIHALRDLTFDLALGLQDGSALAQEIERLLDRLREESGVAVTLSDRIVVEPSVEATCTAHRIVQEALTNVQRHAGATRVDVAVDADDGLYVRVEDDGTGFDLQGALPEPGHMGLAMMRQRAEALGGWLTIQSVPGAGTIVEFSLPLDPQDA